MVDRFFLEPGLLEMMKLGILLGLMESPGLSHMNGTPYPPSLVFHEMEWGYS